MGHDTEQTVKPVAAFYRWRTDVWNSWLSEELDGRFRFVITFVWTRLRCSFQRLEKGENTLRAKSPEKGTVCLQGILLHLVGVEGTETGLAHLVWFVVVRLTCVGPLKPGPSSF